MSNKNRTAEDIDSSFPAYRLQPQLQNDEIDLKELFVALWKGKWIILLTTAIFSGVGVFYALSLPNIYKAEVVLAPAQDSGKSGLAGMAAQFGGLASLAGINISGGSGTDNTTLALATLKSRKFINAFIREHELLVPLMAAERWDATNKKLIIDPLQYDENLNEWVREIMPSKQAKPSDWEAYKVFTKDVLGVSKVKDTGLVTITTRSYSPELAQEWATLLVSSLNSWMKVKSLTETKRNIGYLEEQLKRTKVADMRTVFYQLIEEQTKNLMLAEVESEFAFKIIDPAVIPEEESEPKRTLIFVLATLLGCTLSIAILLLRFVFKK